MAETHEETDTGAQFLKISDIAYELKVSTETVRRWIREGGIPFSQPSARTTRVRRSDLDEFLARRSA